MKISTSTTAAIKNSTAKKGKALKELKEGLSRLRHNSDVIDLSGEAKNLLKKDLPGYLAQKVATTKAYGLAEKMADFALGGAQDGFKSLTSVGEGTEDKASKVEKRTDFTQASGTEDKLAEQSASEIKKEILREEKRNEDALAQKELSAKEIKSKAVEKDVVKNGTLKKPGIFFLTGMRLLGMTDYGGIEKMAEKIQGARFYGHDQVDEIIREIDKRSPEQPVVLVGHSFGADSAVEIAKRLNSLEHAFRRVDLLVTLDAVGFDHSIIPQNVAKHLNFFGEKSWFLNDGPHVARDTSRSEVLNVLRPEDHDQLDDSPEIQFAIVEGIREALAKVAG